MFNAQDAHQAPSMSQRLWYLSNIYVSNVVAYMPHKTYSTDTRTKHTTQYVLVLPSLTEGISSVLSAACRVWARVFRLFCHSTFRKYCRVHFGSSRSHNAFVSRHQRTTYFSIFCWRHCEAFNAFTALFAACICFLFIYFLFSLENLFFHCFPVFIFISPFPSIFCVFVFHSRETIKRILVFQL